MSQKTPPTYTPPAPVYAMSGADAQTQGYGLAQQEYGPQMGAQAQGIADINQGAGYYNSFGPSSLSQAMGNTYMQNVVPQADAAAMNQLANSGMQNSPAAGAVVGNINANAGINIGQYEQGLSNQNATNNLSQLMSINPTSYVNPITQGITNQSNINTGLTNQYNQAVAQQQYQQQYNQYAQNNALASTIGQLSPIGGQIYGATTGTSGSAFSGTANMLGSPGSALAMNQMMNQYNMQPGSYSPGSNGLGTSGNSGYGAMNNSYADSASSGYGSSMPVQGGNAFGSINMAQGLAAASGG